MSGIFPSYPFAFWCTPHPSLAHETPDQSTRKPWIRASPRWPSATAPINRAYGSNSAYGLGSGYGLKSIFSVSNRPYDSQEILHIVISRLLTLITIVDQQFTKINQLTNQTNVNINVSIRNAVNIYINRPTQPIYPYRSANINLSIKNAINIYISRPTQPIDLSSAIINKDANRYARSHTTKTHARYVTTTVHSIEQHTNLLKSILKTTPITSSI